MEIRQHGTDLSAVFRTQNRASLVLALDRKAQFDLGTPNRGCDQIGKTDDGHRGRVTLVRSAWRYRTTAKTRLQVGAAVNPVGGAAITTWLLPPPSRWYEKWPSKRPSPVSRQIRRCKCRKRLCRQTCLQFSQRKSSR